MRKRLVVETARALPDCSVEAHWPMTARSADAHRRGEVRFAAEPVRFRDQSGSRAPEADAGPKGAKLLAIKRNRSQSSVDHSQSAPFPDERGCPVRHRRYLPSLRRGQESTPPQSRIVSRRRCCSFRWRARARLDGDACGGHPGSQRLLDREGVRRRPLASAGEARRPAA
jgi:hypothetical protein